MWFHCTFTALWILCCIFFICRLFPCSLPSSPCDFIVLSPLYEFCVASFLFADYFLVPYPLLHVISLYFHRSMNFVLHLFYLPTISLFLTLFSMWFHCTFTALWILCCIFFICRLFPCSLPSSPCDFIVLSPLYEFCVASFLFADYFLVPYPLLHVISLCFHCSMNFVLHLFYLPTISLFLTLFSMWFHCTFTALWILCCIFFICRLFPCSLPSSPCDFIVLSPLYEFCVAAFVFADCFPCYLPSSPCDFIVLSPLYEFCVAAFVFADYFPCSLPSSPCDFIVLSPLYEFCVAAFVFADYFLVPYPLLHVISLCFHRSMNFVLHLFYLPTISLFLTLFSMWFHCAFTALWILCCIFFICRLFPCSLPSSPCDFIVLSPLYEFCVASFLFADYFLVPYPLLHVISLCFHRSMNFVLHLFYLPTISLFLTLFSMWFHCAFTALWILCCIFFICRLFPCSLPSSPCDFIVLSPLYEFCVASFLFADYFLVPYPLLHVISLCFHRSMNFVLHLFYLPTISLFLTLFSMWFPCAFTALAVMPFLMLVTTLGSCSSFLLMMS